MDWCKDIKSPICAPWSFDWNIAFVDSGASFVSDQIHRSCCISPFYRVFLQRSASRMSAWHCGRRCSEWWRPLMLSFRWWKAFYVLISIWRQQLKNFNISLLLRSKRSNSRYVRFNSVTCIVNSRPFINELFVNFWNHNTLTYSLTHSLIHEHLNVRTTTVYL